MSAQDQLTQKYQRAFQEMDRQQVHVSETRMDGSKLYVLASAPSEDAKNKVWDIIKQIDPSYPDLTMEIRVGHQGTSDLAHGLAAAFRSHETPPFSQMVSQLFGQSNSQQKAGLLNHLFSVTPSSLASEVLGKVRGGGGNQPVTPEQAEKVSPQDVQKLAEHAQQHDSSIIDKVSQFYSQHPGLVKTLGVGALAETVSKAIGGLRGRSGRP